MDLDHSVDLAFGLLALAVAAYAMLAAILSRYSVSAAFSFLVIGAIIGGSGLGLLVEGLPGGEILSLLAEITLAREPVNAIDMALSQALNAALRRAKDDTGARAVIITSACRRIGDRLGIPCEPLVDALEQKEPTPVWVDGFVEQHRFEAFGERLRRTHRHHQEIENAR